MTNYDKRFGDLSLEALQEEAKEAETEYKTKINKLCDAQAKTDLRLMERYHNSLAEICARLQAIDFYIEERRKAEKES